MALVIASVERQRYRTSPHSSGTTTQIIYIVTPQGIFHSILRLFSPTIEFIAVSFLLYLLLLSPVAMVPQGQQLQVIYQQQPQPQQQQEEQQQQSPNIQNIDQV